VEENLWPTGVEFNAVNQEHSNYRHQVFLYSGSRPLSQAKLWCSAALRFRGAKARLRNLTTGSPIAKPATSANGSNCLYKLTPAYRYLTENLRAKAKATVGEKPFCVVGTVEDALNPRNTDEPGAPSMIIHGPWQHVRFRMVKADGSRFKTHSRPSETSGEGHVGSDSTGYEPPRFGVDKAFLEEDAKLLLKEVETMGWRSLAAHNGKVVFYYWLPKNSEAESWEFPTIHSRLNNKEFPFSWTKHCDNDPHESLKEAPQNPDILETENNLEEDWSNFDGQVEDWLSDFFQNRIDFRKFYELPSVPEEAATPPSPSSLPPPFPLTEPEPPSRYIPLYLTDRSPSSCAARYGGRGNRLILPYQDLPNDSSTADPDFDFVPEDNIDSKLDATE